MKKKVIETLECKELQLQEVLKLQKTETKKSKLNDLDKNEIEIKAQISMLQHLLSSDWIKFEDEKPPHEVVLAACDTYDCGWAMDTVWWHEDKQCWMTTGGVESTEAHLTYTHWRKLPPYPNEV